MATLLRAHAADGEAVTYHLATITELDDSWRAASTTTEANHKPAR